MMITTIMVYSLAIGAVLGVGALIADALARRAGISQRFVWFSAIALLVVLTLSAPWRVSESEGVFLPAAADGDVDAGTVSVVDEVWWTMFSDRFVSALSAPGDLLTSIVSRAAVDGSPAINGALGAAWTSLSIVLVVLLALTLRRLDLQRRRMPRAELHGMSVRIGASDGPAVYGVLSPEIVVPSALLSRSHEEQRLVLAHEDEHRSARDPLLLAVTAGLVALMPWHPVAWWCASRVRLATELDCDARVLRRGASARRYGALLLAVAASMSSAPRPKHTLALLDSRRHLERRILAMSTRKNRRAPLAVGALALIGASVVLAACNTDIPTAAQVRDADAQTVVRQLGLPSGSGQIVYYVDGEKMADAETVPADQIASIEVRRKRTADEVSEVYIRTLTSAEGELGRVQYKTSLDGDSVRVRLGRTRYLGEEEARARISDSVAANDAALRDVRVRGTRRMMSSADAGRYDSVTLYRDSSTGATRLKVPNMMLRRTDSTSAAQPLVIIDGVVSSDKTILSRLNPNTIESIEVLKGEAASKIHGARGANGVIQIKTKP